jgi:hypothetical protein
MTGEMYTTFEGALSGWHRLVVYAQTHAEDPLTASTHLEALLRRILWVLRRRVLEQLRLDRRHHEGLSSVAESCVVFNHLVIIGGG